MRNYTPVLVLVIAGLISCNNKKTAPLSEEEAINVIKNFDNGWKSKNMDKVDSALSPKYIYFTQSGGTFSRDSVVATAGEADYQLQNMGRSEFSVDIEGNTAIVSTRWKGKGSYRGIPFDEDQRCSVVVIKNGDEVEILSEHCTPIKPLQVFH